MRKLLGSSIFSYMKDYTRVGDRELSFHASTDIVIIKLFVQEFLLYHLNFFANLKKNHKIC